MALTYVALAGSRADITKADNIGTDTWAFALTNSVPGSTAFVSGTTDLTTVGGYTAGGTNVAITSSSEVAGTLKLILAAPAAWTASGAGFTFRYILLVDKTTNTIPGYWDMGSSIVMSGANGDTFTFTPDATNGVFTVA
jgi:hypothetical protein